MNKSIKRFGYLVACVLLFGSLQAGAAEVGVLQVEQGTHKLLRASGGVTVNCICPGWTETAIIEPQIQAPDAREEGTDSRHSRPLLVRF